MDIRDVRTVRADLWEAQGGLCFYCSVPTVLPEPGLNGANDRRPNIATVEHRTPRCRSYRNRCLKVVACATCNNLKGSMLEPVWVLVKDDHELARRLSNLTHRLHMLDLTTARDQYNLVT